MIHGAPRTNLTPLNKPSNIPVKKREFHAVENKFN
jgi:hypothetical protein